MNGRIAQVDGPHQKKTGRYPIRLDINWLSGESEVKQIKLCNVHPFYSQPNYVDLFACPTLLKNYTNDAKLRESHGRLLNRVLGFAKWFVIQVESLGFEGDLNDFMDLPLTHPLGKKANATMFEYWREPPFRCARVRERYGTALDFVVGLMMHNYPDLEEASIRLASYSAVWPPDGAGGKNMLRNFFHCLKSWKEERVEGGFWVTDEYKTGTVMVHLSDIEDPESFSTVYVVKGHSNSIGELMKRSECSLPVFCRATILPLYDLWTYDGIIFPGDYGPQHLGGSVFEKKLREHVTKAISSHNVSWRGPSAEQGLWDFVSDPPPAPRFIVNEGCHFVIDWQGGTENTSLSREATEMSFTKEEIESARQIVAKALQLGGARKLGEEELTDPPSEMTAMTFKLLHPGTCTILDTRIERAPLHILHYEIKDDLTTPSYPLNNVLQAVLDSMEKAAPLPLVTAIYIDDRDLVRPLDAIMVKAFEEEGLIAPIIEFL